MLGTDGQKVTNVDEAIAFIRQFLRFERDHPDQIDRNKNYDFDLFLPWMMEIVNNAPEEEGSRLPTELDVLYMEAGWELVVRQVLRPGAKTVSGDNPADSYGKGFSLTARGREWLSSD